MMGTLLLCLGVLAIIFGIVEYEETCLKLGAKHKWQPLLMAGLVGLIGVALLVAIYFNV